MQSRTNANTTEATQATQPADHAAHFIAWKYPDGTITIQVEGLDEDADGETLFTFTAHVGVEIGPSQVLALAGEPSMIRFKGTFAEQRQFFIDTWCKLAEENERAALFEEEGLLALAQLDKLPTPPLPAIDQYATMRENEILRVSRERVAKAISNGEKLTLEDCIAIAEAAGAELGGELMNGG